MDRGEARAGLQWRARGRGYADTAQDHEARSSGGAGRHRRPVQRTSRAVYCILTVVLSILALTRVAGAADLACPAAPLQTLDLPATRAAFVEGRQIVIVALGSSSTEGAGATAPDRAYPARLQALLRRLLPEANLVVLNRGKGGQTADEMLARIDADVLAASPTLVIWQDGANAALRDMDPATFERLVDTGMRRILASGADLVLMDNQLAPRILAAPRHTSYGDILAHEASVHRASLFSRSALMQ